MATYLELIKKLMKPDGIRFVVRPRSIPELVISFRNDPVVQHLVKAGRRAAPVICRELRKSAVAMPPFASMRTGSTLSPSFKVMRSVVSSSVPTHMR